MTLDCNRCNGLGWIVDRAGENWPEFCRFCEGRSRFTVRQIAKKARMAVKTVQRILDCGKIRSSTGLKLISALT